MNGPAGSRWWIRQLAVWLVFLCGSGMWLVSQHHERDRWGRKDAELPFPSGPSSTPLLLANSGNIPIYFEIRHPAWDEPRPELLLPGDAQFVDLPDEPASSTEVLAMPLDPQTAGATRVVDVPTGWQRTSIEVREDGAVIHYTREHGDLSPRRGMVGVTTNYALPVHVDLPWDAHERPPVDHVERESWLGPGTGDDTAVCAFALDRATCATLWVPPVDAPVQTFRISPADGATRITLMYDGTLQRDHAPLWRRLAHLASF